MTKELSAKEIEQVAEIVDHVLNRGGVLRDLKGIEKSEIELVYQLAYNFYQAGKLADAEKVFRVLCLFDHADDRYWLGFGATLQMQGKYEEAIEAYSYGALQNIRDPRSPMHAAECHLALGKKNEAMSALRAAIEFSGANEKHRSVKDRARVMLKMMECEDESSVAMTA